MPLISSGLLFSKNKSASYHDIPETDSQSNSSTNIDYSGGFKKGFGQGKAPHKGSLDANNNLEAYRQRVKG